MDDHAETVLAYYHSKIKQHIDEKIIHVIIFDRTKDFWKIYNKDGDHMNLLGKYSRVKRNEIQEKEIPDEYIAVQIICWDTRQDWQFTVEKSIFRDYGSSMPVHTINIDKMIGCAKCGKEAQVLMRCASCKLVKYCSRECQKQDWAQHRELCKAIK